MMSRKEKKHKKKTEKLQKEYAAAEIEEDRNIVLKHRTDLLTHIFLVYFKILKSQVKPEVLTATLEGLSKFAHLINLEFFDDMIAVLSRLVDSDYLSYRDILYCLKTVFVILSGKGEALNIDPQGFYKHFYNLILFVNCGVSTTEIPVLLNCLDVMIVKRRKQVTFQRLLAFIKRVCTIALQFQQDGALGLLGMVRSMFKFNSKCNILLDSDYLSGPGVFHSEMDDPEHCNANATVLWELHYFLHHYHPKVQKMAEYILKGCPLKTEGMLSQDLAKDGIDLYNDYNSLEMNFKPEFENKCQSSRKRKKEFYVASNMLYSKMAKVADLEEFIKA